VGVVNLPLIVVVLVLLSSMQAPSPAWVLLPLMVTCVRCFVAFFLSMTDFAQSGDLFDSDAFLLHFFPLSGLIIMVWCIGGVYILFTGQFVRRTSPLTRFDTLVVSCMLIWILAANLFLCGCSVLVFRQLRKRAHVERSQAGTAEVSLLQVQGNVLLEALTQRVSQCSQQDEMCALPGGSTCCICMEAFLAGEELRELVCRHTYHSDCISQWFGRGGRSCPMRCIEPAPSRPELPLDEDETATTLGSPYEMQL